MKGPRETDFAYQAVYRYLTSLISEHATDARVRLPSLRQLAQRLNVSISTIQYAYSLLEKGASTRWPNPVITQCRCRPSARSTVATTCWKWSTAMRDAWHAEPEC
jgi:DNA-binding transcriptional MocR family regulator